MRTLIFLLFVPLLACDEARSILPGADAAPSGVVVADTPDTPVPQLDPEAVCEALYLAVTRSVPNETRCVVPGLVAGSEADSDPQSACSSAAATCTQLANLGPDSLPDLPTGPCPFTRPEAAACDATLTDLQPCLDAMADTASDQIQATLTCALADTSGVPDVQVTLPEAAEVQACALFTAACPGFFGEPEADAGADAGDAGITPDGG